MIEADDGKPRRARPTPDSDVIFGIEEIPVRVVRQVSRLDRLEDLALPTDQHAATLEGIRPLGVAEDRLEGGAVQFTTHNCKLKMAEWQ